MTKFLTIATLILVTRFYDIFTTSLYTPDLANESNPIVLWFGAGWSIALTVQIVVSLLVIYFFYFYSFKFKSVIPDDKSYSFKEYISYFHFYKPNALYKVLYNFPKNKIGFISSIGYVVAYTLIIVSLLVGTSTTMLLLSEGYREIYSAGIPYLLYTIILGTAIYFYWNFFKKEYQRYKFMGVKDTRDI